MHELAEARLHNGSAAINYLTGMQLKETVAWRESDRAREREGMGRGEKRGVACRWTALCGSLGRLPRLSPMQR